MSGLIKPRTRRLSANTWTIVNPAKHWGQGEKGGWKIRACTWERWCSGWNIFIRQPLSLGSNTLDPLVTNPARWLSDGPSTSLNLLLINLSAWITLNIRSSWTLSICLCITGGRLLLEKPSRYISVIKWCAHPAERKPQQAKECEAEEVEGIAGKRERFRLQIKCRRKRMRHAGAGAREGVFVYIGFVLSPETQCLLLCWASINSTEAVKERLLAQRGV